MDDALSTTFSFACPSGDALKSADSTAKIKALQIPQTATLFESRKIFALPPFVGVKFLDLDSQPCNFILAGPKFVDIMLYE